jgi:hypothetical protein
MVASHLITLGGKTRTVTQWAQVQDLTPRLIYARLKSGWTSREAITRPNRERRWPILRPLKKRFFAEYRVWQDMRRRCYDSKRKGYHNYGGRGIKVCARWQVFENFIIDMGPRPTAKHSLDRKKNNDNYYPRNCRWATKKEQRRNSRTSHYLTFRGKKRTIIEWSEITGIDNRLILTRITRLGWSVRLALTTPPRPIIRSQR